MERKVQTGDVVVSTVGRDKGIFYLVVRTQENIAYVTDGRKRKVNNLKKKNFKHVKTVVEQAEIGLAMKIQNGETVGNERVYRSVRAEKQKLQED